MNSYLNKLLVLSLLAPSIAHASDKKLTWEQQYKIREQRRERENKMDNLFLGTVSSFCTMLFGYLANSRFDAYNKAVSTPRRFLGYSETTKINNLYGIENTRRPVYSYSSLAEDNLFAGQAYTSLAALSGFLAICSFYSVVREKLAHTLFKSKEKPLTNTAKN